MRLWIGRWVFLLAVCTVFSLGCGGSGAEQSQLAAGSSPPPMPMTTAGTTTVPPAGVAGQTAAPAAGSGVGTTPPSAAGSGGNPAGMTPPSAAGTGGSMLAAGSGGSAGQAAPSSTARLPCDVAGVIGRQCLSCHGSPTNLGAPMMLVTYADFHRPAVSNPDKQVYELVGTRVVDTQRPMPPRSNGKIAVADQQVLTTWASQGGPALPPTAADCAR